jgi:hypothetical protein
MPTYGSDDPVGNIFPSYDMNGLLDELGNSESETDDQSEDGWSMDALMARLKENSGTPMESAPQMGQGEGYSWQGDGPKLFVKVPLPNGTRSKAVEVDVSSTGLRVGLTGVGATTIVSGDLAGRCRPTSTFWTIESDDNGDKVVLIGKFPPLTTSPTAVAQPDLAACSNHVTYVTCFLVSYGLDLLVVDADVEKASPVKAWSALFVGERDPLRATVTSKVLCLPSWIGTIILKFSL